MKVACIIKEPGKTPKFQRIEAGHENLQRLVKGYVERLKLTSDLSVLVNEEGKIKGLPYNFTLCSHVIVGTAIFIGTDGEEFADCPLTPELAQMLIPEMFTVISDKALHTLGAQINLGGHRWTVIDTEKDRVKCIMTECCVLKRAFDRKGCNDFAASDIRQWLNEDFMRVLHWDGVPPEALCRYSIDLVGEDGAINYDFDLAEVGLLTSMEYSFRREYIPKCKETWWTATPESPYGPFVKGVNADGELINVYPSTKQGVRPVCVFDIKSLRGLGNGMD